MERDDLVVQMFHELRGMVFNFACKFNLEFDDCMQEAALVMLNAWPRIPAECANVKAYLNGCVRRELYKLLSKRGQETLSLDAPIAPDSGESFADMLANFVEQDTRRAALVEKTVHNAMHSLSLEVQLHAMSFYNLGSYKPVLPRKSLKVAYGRKKEYMRKSLKSAFRRDPQVLALMR